jgi:hypothetical protein
MEPQSLWLKLLKQSTVRPLPTDSTVILLGDMETNKRTLLSYLCFDKLQGNQQNTPKLQTDDDEYLLSLLENVNYDYFDIDNNSLESCNTRVNIWSVDQRMFPSHLLEIIKVRGFENQKVCWFYFFLPLM